MRFRFLISNWTLAVLLLLVAEGQARAADAMLAKLLDNQTIGRVSMSVHAVRLSDGHTLYEKNPDTLVSPASVTKVLTAAAAISRFGPAHTFKTKFYHTGSRKGDKILGSLVVVGDGDPFLVSEKLWQLAADLRNMGIREFKGDLIVDNSLFAGDQRDESRQVGSKATRNAYDAPVTAFGVNFNSMAVMVAPGEVGKPAYVELDPYPLRHVSLENAVVTNTGKSGRSLDVKRTSKPGKQADIVSVSGTIASNAAPQKIYRSVGDANRAAGEYLMAFLKHEGIRIGGDVKEGRKPQDAELLYTLDSYEMRRIVQGLNVFSNNYIGDMLVKRLGAAYPQKGLAMAPGSGSYENGIAAIENFLRKDVGVKGEMTLLNGSGLATENRLTARQVTAVLAHMERHWEYFPDFLASLPANGQDGTLKRRFTNGDITEFKGQFRAKSGTLSEPIAVSGLAGYFRHPRHGVVAFCMIDNGREGGAQPSLTDLRDRQDRVLVAFVNEL